MLSDCPGDWEVATSMNEMITAIILSLELFCLWSMKDPWGRSLGSRRPSDERSQKRSKNQSIPYLWDQWFEWKLPPQHHSKKFLLTTSLAMDLSFHMPTLNSGIAFWPWRHPSLCFSYLPNRPRKTVKLHRYSSPLCFLIFGNEYIRTGVEIERGSIFCTCSILLFICLIFLSFCWLKASRNVRMVGCGYCW
jgi:hypothetical protein